MDCQAFSNTKVYFPSSADENEKTEIRKLVAESCERIWGRNSNDMDRLSNIVDFIVYKPIDNGQNVGASPDGGAALRSNWWYWVIYYPNPKKFIHRETRLYILAHEFAHVFYEHPAKSSSNPEEFEIEADKKAIEWGFRPHDDDVHLLRTYQNNLSAGLLD